MYALSRTFQKQILLSEPAMEGMALGGEGAARAALPKFKITVTDPVTSKDGECPATSSSLCILPLLPSAL